MIYNKRQKKRETKKVVIKQIILCLILIVFIIIISIPLTRKISRQYVINKEIKQLEEEIKLQEEKNFELKEFLNYLNSDQYIGEQAKLNLNFKKENEEVAVIVGLEDLESNNKERKGDFFIGEEKESLNNPQEWFNYFFK